AAMHWIANGLIPAVTQAANDPALTQERLSERLANRGILPMFGFPTGIRYLHHGPPRIDRPNHVDRELELAISQFAPGAETVKERTIHTAIGAAHYVRRGQTFQQDPDPLGPSVQIGLCGRCQHVETAQPNQPTCPACGAPAGVTPLDYRSIDLRQPKGFCSFYAKARDYDGSFDFVPRAARPKVGRPRFASVNRRNFVVGAGPARLYVINDNAGRLFTLSKSLPNSEAMIDRDAAESAN